MEKQDAFTQALLRAIDAAEQEAGVRQPRLRRAVEQYGGRVWAENRESGGARFTFTVPAMSPEDYQLF